MNFDLDDHLVLQVLGGSHGYGTADADSDLDLRGVIIPPERYFYGMESFEQHVSINETDFCYYDLRKFFRLALQGNPSVLEVFHAPRVKVMLPFANTILDMWKQVISKRIVKSHVGMAYSHLKKLRIVGRNCGQKGRVLIERHGYNTKDAAHVIRVLGQCVEILMSGTLTLPRPDAATLKSIKGGEWKIEAVESEAARLMDLVRQSEASSSLPEDPDFNLVNENVCHIVHGWVYTQRSKCKKTVLRRRLPVDGPLLDEHGNSASEVER